MSKGFSRRGYLRAGFATASISGFAGCMSDPPKHVSGVEGSTFPPQEMNQHLDRKFSHESGDYSLTFEAEVPRRLVEYYTDRFRTSDYGAYVADRHDDDYVSRIAQAVRDFGKRKDLPELEVAHVAVSIVQNMKYTPDGAGKGFEYPQYPVETMAERGGDCEDTCILAAAILEELGYSVVLLGFPRIYHMALGVRGGALPNGGRFEYEGEPYFYLETTSGGWAPGELPQLVGEYLQKTSSPEVVIYEIDRSPVTVFSWNTELTDSNKIRTNFRLANAGDGVAEDIKIEVTFRSSSGVEAKATTDGLGDLPPEKATEGALVTDPPSDIPLTIQVNTYLGDRKDGEDWSEPLRP